jgi:hypothetical protein
MWSKPGDMEGGYHHLGDKGWKKNARESKDNINNGRCTF